MESTIYKSDCPWSNLIAAEETSCEGGRPCIVIPDSFERITATGISDELPLLSQWVDDNGQTIRRFELPSPAAETDAGSVSDGMTVWLSGRGVRDQSFSLSLEQRLPRPSQMENGQEAAPSPQDIWQQAALAATELIDTHIEFVNTAFDENTDSDNNDWQGHAEGLAVRPLEAGLKAWEGTSERDEPRIALIVSLARSELYKRFRQLLEDVFARPRVVLTRQRQMQPIGRIQQIDPACIRWIVRQPGITLAQKAGVRQEALGVVRKETADTLENRVVKDLVRRAVLACSRYLAENRRFGDHERTNTVRSFRTKLRKCLQNSRIAEVGSLVGIAHPNYVLQHDCRYHPLWKVYQILVRQQHQQDEAWRWQQRIWAEHVRFAVMACMRRINGCAISGNSDILIRPEQVAGNFVDSRTAPGSWRLASEPELSDLDFVTSPQLDAHQMIPAGLKRLSPDCVIVKRALFGERPQNMLAIWSVFDFDLTKDSLKQRAMEISEALQSLPCEFPLSGLLVQPYSHSLKSASTSTTAESPRCKAIRMPANNHSELSRLSAMLRQGLNI